jgi:Phage tail assembly chaperone proteins, E, or 41 or 14/Phage P2 GpE
MSKTVTHHLVRPLTRGETTITSLTLREPDVGALRGLKLTDVLTMDVGAIITLLSRINVDGVSASDLNGLSAADITMLASKTMLFMVSADQAAQIKDAMEIGEEIFHWPPASFDTMGLDELTRWHGLAIERLKAKLGHRPDD